MRCLNSKTNNRWLTSWKTMIKMKKMFSLMPWDRPPKMPLLISIKTLLKVLLLKKLLRKKQPPKKPHRKPLLENQPRQQPSKMPSRNLQLQIPSIKLLLKIPLFKQQHRKPLKKRPYKRLHLYWPLGKTFQANKKNAYHSNSKSNAFLGPIAIPHLSLRYVRITS